MTRTARAILFSCEVPWDPQENLMEEAFRQEIRCFLSRGFDHPYIFGTAGEGYAVDTARFKRIAEIFLDETRGRCPSPQVGVIGLSTATVRERLDIAYAMGFRSFQISLPSWGALSDAELLRFFKDVCLSYPDCEFLHYNLIRSKRVLTADDYRRIIDEVPNLVATKNTGTDVSLTIALMSLVPEMQHFFGEITFPIGCLHGECSLLSSWAGLFPSKTKQFFSYSSNGSFAELFRFQKEYLTAMNRVLALMLRYPRIDGAYDKALVRLGGIPMPLRMLSPYEGLPEEAYQECKRIVDELSPEWLG
jgi:dihydrodipicolinate synthase/N-acetylneuraminate lyase